MDQNQSINTAQAVKVAYLLSYPSDFNNGDETDIASNVKRFSTLNEVYEYITNERLDRFTIEKIVKTTVAERL